MRQAYGSVYAIMEFALGQQHSPDAIMEFTLGQQHSRSIKFGDPLIISNSSFLIDL